MSIMKRGTKNTIFRELFMKNSGWFVLELACSYLAAKVLLLGNNRISDAIDAMFAGNLGECIDKQFWIYVGVLVVLGFAFTYIQSIATKIFAANMQTGFRAAAGKKLMQLEYRYFDTHTSGRVLNNFLDDVAKISDYYSEILPTIVTSVVTIVTIIFSLARLDGLLTALLLVVVPVMMLVSRLTGEKVSGLTRKHSQYHDEVNELAYDAISGINVVKSYNLEDYFKDKIKKTNRTILGFEYRRNAISSIAWVAGDIVQCAPCVILGIAALWRVQTGHITIGEMSYFMLLLDRVVPPLGMLPHYFIDARINLVSRNRLEEIMDYPSESAADGNGNSMCGTTDTGNGACAVEFKNVSFAYDTSGCVLDDFNLRIEKGRNVAIVGESGGGKSTIFKLLLGLYEPKTGSVQIQGKPAKDIPDTEKRHLFGYVEQSFHMVPGTVKEQITLYDPSITMEDVRAAAKMTGLDDTIMSLEHGYDTPCSDGIFSQGQWQLLSIARAAAAKPKLLLLDEITANLDAQTEKEVLQALKRVSENRTVISISHRVNATTGRVIEI